MIELDTIVCAKAEDYLATLSDNSVDLTVTSPPYDNLRTYKGFTFDFECIARQIYRVTKQGGVVVWIVGDATVNGSETLTSMRQALYFVDVCGFRMHQTIIFEKDAMPFPPQKRYYDTFEYAFVLSKGEIKTFNGISEKSRTAGQQSRPTHRQKNGDTKQSENITTKPTRLLTNVWRFGVGYMKTTQDDYAYEHPAMFPEALAERHILTWSNAGDVVLDPFMGSGTTAKMAAINRRSYIGCDISADYVTLATKRLGMGYTPNMFEGITD